MSGTKTILPPSAVEDEAFLQRLVAELSPTSRRRLRELLDALEAAPATREEASPLILFGSQTGNAERVARRLAEHLGTLGRPARLLAMDQYPAERLAREPLLLAVVSTQGDGDPPDNALGFFDTLARRGARRLPGLAYAVLALGDSSYRRFCEAGRRLDARLAELGAERLHPLVTCDVDFESTAERWIETVAAACQARADSRPAALAAMSPFTAVQAGSVPDRAHPFLAEVLANEPLHGRGAKKDTRHLVLSLAGSGLRYLPGDALGIYAENDPALVTALVEAAGWAPDTPVPTPTGESLPVVLALTRVYAITQLTPALLRDLAAYVPALGELVAQPDRLAAYRQGRDILDLVRDFGLKGLSAPEVVRHLPRLAPRLYSIASSRLAFPEEVHCTVRAVRYEAHGRRRAGVASVHIAERCPEGDHLPVYVQPNPHFRLPPDPERPILLVGAGTGVAPFRAFLQEREFSGATGRAWLFFGEWHFRTDFLYQVEWLRWLKMGVLSRLDVAFSRDGEQKVYVQHRLWEHAREVYGWLTEGAHLYVCGSTALGRDVEATLCRILAAEGGMDEAEARERLLALRRQHRYHRDVY